MVEICTIINTIVSRDPMGVDHVMLKNCNLNFL